LAEERLPCCIEGFEAEPFEVFQCELGDDGHEMHGAFLDELADPRKDAFFCWLEGDETQYVFASKICRKRANEDDLCTLYVNHSGVCRWALIDPVRVAIQAQVDQAMAKWRDMGFTPRLPKRGSE
jgi:hypothetical protein